MLTVYYFTRVATKSHPAGITVTKQKILPEGDFGLTEYTWGEVSLWFMDSDNFTSDERQDAYEAHREAKPCR